MGIILRVPRMFALRFELCSSSLQERSLFLSSLHLGFLLTCFGQQVCWPWCCSWAEPSPWKTFHTFSLSLSEFCQLPCRPAGVSLLEDEKSWEAEWKHPGWDWRMRESMYKSPAISIKTASRRPSEEQGGMNCLLREWLPPQKNCSGDQLALSHWLCYFIRQQ